MFAHVMFLLVYECCRLAHGISVLLQADTKLHPLRTCNHCAHMVTQGRQVHEQFNVHGGFAQQFCSVCCMCDWLLHSG